MNLESLQFTDRVRESPGTTILLLAIPVILVFGLLGDLYAAGKIGHGTFVDLDSEYTVPAFWSGALLAGACAAGTLVYRLTKDRGVLVLAVLFGYMAIDEVTGLHEQLEFATGIDWETLFLPVFVFVAVDLLVVLRRYWGEQEGWLMLAGAAAWGVSQILEKLEWSGGGDVKTGHYIWKMVPEEMLEMLGSLLFLAAFLTLWQRLSRDRP